MRTKDYFQVEIDTTHDVYFEDIMDNIPSPLIIEECKTRGLSVQTSESSDFLQGNSDENRRELCRLLELNMHTSKEEVINEIKTKL